MLRITTDESSEPIRLRLEGKLSGAWVAELEQFYASRKQAWGQKQLVLDLNSLTGADAAGRYLLALLQREGVSLDHSNPLAAPLMVAFGSKDNR
jgi:hypothetical protein